MAVILQLAAHRQIMAIATTTDHGKKPLQQIMAKATTTEHFPFHQSPNPVKSQKSAYIQAYHQQKHSLMNDRDH